MQRIRNPKESAVYRSLHTPFGYPLVAGLGLPTEQKYSTRHGDITDIWKLQCENGKGKILSVKGVEVVEVDTGLCSGCGGGGGGKLTESCREAHEADPCARKSSEEYWGQESGDLFAE